MFLLLLLLLLNGKKKFNLGRKAFIQVDLINYLLRLALRTSTKRPPYRTNKSQHVQVAQ